MWRVKIKCVQYKISEITQFPLKKKKEFCTSSINDFYRLEGTRVLLKIKYIVRSDESDDRVKGYRNCLTRLKEKETSNLQRKVDI